MNENADDKKLDWMYKGANSLVNRDEYLLGKPVDKQLEQINQEERDKKLGLVPPKNHVEHECIPPSIRDFNKILQVEQVDLSAKLQEDPLVAIRKIEEEARRQFLQNPIQLKKLQDAMKDQELKKTKKIKKKRRYKCSDSDSDLDKQIAKKLKALKRNPLALGIAKKEKESKVKDNYIDIILMHKYNELKDKLSQQDMDDILAGRTSSSSESGDGNDRRENRRNSSSESENRNKKCVNKTHKREREDTRRGYGKNNKDHRSRDKSDSTEDEIDSVKIKQKNKKYNIHSNERYRSTQRKRDDNDRTKEYKKDSSEERNYQRKKGNIASYCIERNANNKLLKTKEREHKRYSRTEDNGRTRRYRSSSRETKKIRRKERLKQRESSSEDSGKNRKSKRESSNSRDNSDAGIERKSKKYDKSNKNTSNYDFDKSNTSSTNPVTESELDKIILQKLRMLRDETDKKGTEPEKHEEQVYYHYNSDDDEHVYKKKSFGLVRADGTKIMLKGNAQSSKHTETKKVEPSKEPERKIRKKLTDKEKEEFRQQMMIDAQYRDKERSNNLKKFREEDEKEEREMKLKDFDKDFMHKELLKSTKGASVESRIKSKLSNIQRSSRDMASNFSKR